jgi:hypothetical protein
MRRLDMPEWIQRAEFKVVPRLKADTGEMLHGQATWMPEERASEILVASNPDLQVMIETTIHECLHILYEGHRYPQETYDESYELGLNRTAAALYIAWLPKKKKKR